MPVNKKEGHVWRAIGKSVQGASHRKTNLPNQDAIEWLPDKGEGPPLVVAISDGHGSPKCFRSDEGSRLAVTTAISLIGEFLESINGLKDTPGEPNESAILRLAEDHLPRKIVRAWMDKVAKHVAEHPFRPEELDTLEQKSGPKARQSVEAHPALAYGATLLSALVTDSYILYLQLGDGDILVVDKAGAVTRPMPADERLIANETTSLCAQNAWLDFRVECQWLHTLPPALILLSTDGYSNSFPDEANFQKIGPDYLQLIRERGLHSVSQDLERWLSESSTGGSGDDITLGIIKRREQGDKEWADDLETRITEVAGAVTEHETKLSDLSLSSEKLTDEIEDQKLALRDCQTDVTSQRSLVENHEAILVKNSNDLEDITRRLQEVESKLPHLKQVEDDNREMADRILKLRRGIILVTLLALASAVLSVVMLVKASSMANRTAPSAAGKSADGAESKMTFVSSGSGVAQSPAPEGYGADGSSTKDPGRGTSEGIAVRNPAKKSR